MVASLPGQGEITWIYDLIFDQVGFFFVPYFRCDYSM